MLLTSCHVDHRWRVRVWIPHLPLYVAVCVASSPGNGQILTVDPNVVWGRTHARPAYTGGIPGARFDCLGMLVLECVLLECSIECVLLLDLVLLYSAPPLPSFSSEAHAGTHWSARRRPKLTARDRCFKGSRGQTRVPC